LRISAADDRVLALTGGPCQEALSRQFAQSAVDCRPADLVSFLKLALTRYPATHEVDIRRYDLGANALFNYVGDSSHRKENPPVSQNGNTIIRQLRGFVKQFPSWAVEYFGNGLIW